MVEKITPRTPLTAPSQNQAQAKGGGFQAALDQAMAEPGSARTAASATGSAGLDPLLGLGLKSGSEPVARAEQTLNMLEQASQALADPATSLKEMAPLMAALDLEADKLAADADGLPAGDGAGPLLRQTAVTAKVLVAKFNRGDYV